MSGASRHERDLEALFRLRPLKGARVSEISETVAASGAAPDERVNFHIGNPAQDQRLSDTYLRIALGIEAVEPGVGSTHEELAEAAGGRPDEVPLVAFLDTLIRKSAPYAPRGGFPRTAPNAVAAAFQQWLEHQQEPLAYDMGQASGKREIIFASGGWHETLRVLFHALSATLVAPPAHVFFVDVSFTIPASDFPGLEFLELAEDDSALLRRLESEIGTDPQHPSYLILGRILREETRRALRHLCLDVPLFIVEINDAPNHLSLAREARLTHRVLRILSPAVLLPEATSLSLTFIAGPAELLAVLDAFHFQLKGTPSAAEIELLTHLLAQPAPPADGARHSFVDVTPAFEGISPVTRPSTTFELHARHASEKLKECARSASVVVESSSLRIERFIGRASSAGVRDRVGRMDPFVETSSLEFLGEMITHVRATEWQKSLTESFLHAFIVHHPEYDPAHAVVVSGSSRTALGLLGFHCGIDEVIIPDLSWSYEHCFPTVRSVPLTSTFQIDTDAIIDAVRRRMETDPSWTRHGAVALNNPHNATGRVFDASAIRQLLRWLLSHGVYVIDDLSYQEVAPSEELPGTETVRQAANALVSEGSLTEEEAAHVITVHSLSKTDCLAGARLAVVEIREDELFDRFGRLIRTILPNCGAIALTYLFYRTKRESARAYWRLRNTIFLERSRALLEAVAQLPAERNPFHLSILPPTGSMYPLLLIRDLPPGLSLDWLASGLARQGIGMLPLATFARTEEGYEMGRRAFRLTLGGTDGADVLLKKTRRVLIDLNRLIAQESARYLRKRIPLPPLGSGDDFTAGERERRWNAVADAIHAECKRLETQHHAPSFVDGYLPGRLRVYRQRFADRSAIIEAFIAAARADRGRALTRRLEKEFSRDSLHRRVEAFAERSYDRTVHPTQMYSLACERAFDRIISMLIHGTEPRAADIRAAADELLREHHGLNVAIASSQESDELLLDLEAIIAAEQRADLAGEHGPQPLLSFWGDWDGSSRPSGQGHRLVATTLIANVDQLARILSRLHLLDPALPIERTLIEELPKLPERAERFMRLLNDITSLTHQLEKRYRGVLPISIRPGRLRRLGMRLHLARDPLARLWHHNDRLERRMVELRTRRRTMLEQYFELNKRLRKQLAGLLPEVGSHLEDRKFLLAVSGYRDLLQRFVITPRIHQSMVTAQDQFAIDTTVHNIEEINAIAGAYGTPGVILALQVSMSTKPDALIALDRKFRAAREQALRDRPGLDLPQVRLIPLFEDLDAVKNIPAYLGKLWSYALESRRVNEDPSDRFAEIVAEVFIAGSDLSQQISQTAGAAIYRRAKQELMTWLAERHLVDRVRIKFGSGEPMQRQGGAYAPVSGLLAFERSPEELRQAEPMAASGLPDSARRSTAYATTPLMGIFTGGDLRTLQSTVSEQLRHLPVDEMVQVLYHLRESQRQHRNDLIRAAETLVETRLLKPTRGMRELERLTIGARDPVFDRFVSLLTEDFRQILYGREEDVVGVHLVSYFIARTMPQLRDRPTIRPSGGADADRGQRILGDIARMVPMASHGTLLRAISHNQAQTAVLGLNQLTTGLFRALDRFIELEFTEGEAETLIAERLLPHLPVYEILHTLRMYHDPALTWLRRVEAAFPAGNSAFLALREDNDAMLKYVPLFQQELVRRHGLSVPDFFEGGVFNPALLSAVRPDLAVLLQADLFNTSAGKLIDSGGRRASELWKPRVEELLVAPERIRSWRSKIWELLEHPIIQRIDAFAELAVALNSLSSAHPLKQGMGRSQSLRISSGVTQFFRSAQPGDDMRQFLAAALDYLSAITEGMAEVPVAIIRSMRELERIVRIEEQALAPEQQERLRFYTLQIARCAGENG